MHTIAIISQKGGTGKTTLATHLAVEAFNSGIQTALIDLDPQQSAATWKNDFRGEDKPPPLMSVQSKQLTKDLDRLSSMGGQLAVIDTAPHSGSIALDAAKLADLILIPCRTGIDVAAIMDSLNIAAMANTPAFVVLNGVKPTGHDKEHAEKALKQAGATVCPVKIGDRVAYSRALIRGLTAPELEPNGKAAEETKKLFRWVNKQLKGKGAANGKVKAA